MTIAPPSRPGFSTWPHEAALMAAVGVFFSLTGLFDTDQVSQGLRLIYWVAVMVAGGGVILITEALYARLAPAPLQDWRISLGLVALLATTPQTGIVAYFEVNLFRHASTWSALPRLWVNVGIVVVPVVVLLRALRQTLQRRGGRALLTEVDQAPSPAPSAQAMIERAPPALLAQKMPARLREADLIALQAEDHYVRVHTTAGSDLVLIRFSDALTAVAERQGFRLHRSWWAAAGHIQSARYRRGTGEAVLAGNITAPISRTHAPALRSAGFLN